MCKCRKYFVILTICFYWIDIHTVDSADKLDFWEPDPKFNARRANDHGYNNIEEKQHFHYNHKTAIEKSPGSNVEVEDNIRQRGQHQDPRLRSRNRELDRTRKIKHSRSSVQEEHKRDRGIALRHGREQGLEGELWQNKPESRVRYKSDRKNLRSTRLTPMYLMQQSPEPKELSSDNFSYPSQHKMTVDPLQRGQRYWERNRSRKRRQALFNLSLNVVRFCAGFVKTYSYFIKLHRTTQTPEIEYELLQLSSYCIAKQMDGIMGNFMNANSTVEIIGRTAAYNDIVLVKITEKKQDAGTSFRAEESKYIDEQPEKKIIFIVHGLSIMGIHVLPCFTYRQEFSKLVSYYLEHLDKFDIFLIPLANPDGYATMNKLWNKNISPQTACPGVCLDRNFDVAWNTSKQISSCSQLYAGPRPFSEPETRAIRDVFHDFSHKIIAYIHVHAGGYNYADYKGEAVLYPKGYTDAQTDDDKYLDLRGEIDEAMRNASFQITSVTVDTLYNWYGKVSGSSVDYATTVYGIPFAMEFVMQLYFLMGNLDDTLNTFALEEIWKRIIDVIFNNIWKSTNANDVK